MRLRFLNAYRYDDPERAVLPTMLWTQLTEGAITVSQLAIGWWAWAIAIQFVRPSPPGWHRFLSGPDVPAACDWTEIMGSRIADHAKQLRSLSSGAAWGLAAIADDLDECARILDNGGPDEG